MKKFQYYNHYKLPVTLNPLEYGKLIFNKDNIFIIQTSSLTIAVITQLIEFNDIKIFRDGDFKFNYKDHKINENTFIRSLENKKFTFKNNELIQIDYQKSVRTLIIINIILFLYYLLEDIYLFLLNYKNYVFKNYQDELFILFELTLIFYIFFFVIYQVESSMMMIAAIKGKYFKSNWNSIFFNIENKIFSRELLEFYFSKFWKIVSPKIFEGCHIFILLKIQFEDGNFHVIGKLIRLDHNNYLTFIDQIINYLEGMGDYYKQSPFKKIIFSYGFKKGEISENISKIEKNLIEFKDMRFVISTDPKDFGKIINKQQITDGNIYTIQDSFGRIVIFKEFENENQLEFFKNGLSIINFKDIKFEDNKFLRIINKRKLFFENGNKTLEITLNNTPFLTKLKKDKVEINNFITLDIETFVQNDILIPYLISFYDGIKSHNFYLSDYNNSIDLMMQACFKKLFIRKYNKYQVYIHNFTKFDIVFLLKYLIKHVQVNPLIHKGRIIQLKINYGDNLQYHLNMKDSYLILLSSLETLCKSFKIKNPKSIFPHLFVSENNLNYLGEVPASKNFFKISENDYQNYKNSFNSLWNLKNESIKYCEIDCISLYQIILKFNSLIFNNFNKNIHKYPTLPSLAFAIFRSSFMSEENIPKLTGNIEKDIREGYTGGSTDMFIPYGKNIKCLDVNSLYPSVMIKQNMPIGSFTTFDGNIREIDPNAFGFFYVKVNCPKDIVHPIIQIKYKINGSIKTISPVGSWTMWIFSEEMDNALKYGYTFEILRGYTFEKGITFKSYVSFLYNLRTHYSKENPLNLIAKILLNSLYGRFGMNEILIKYEIFSKEEFSNISEDLILDYIEIDDLVLVGLKIEKVENSSNISIGVAAAITAYARIYMSQFKNNPKINLYYTDTDSIYTDSEIDPSLIDPKILGKLKLEYICEEAVFLGPKSYCLKTKDGLISKVKGFKNPEVLNIQDFKDLLIRDAYKIVNHEKWIRNLSDGKITIKEQLYKLIATENKRKFIFENNKVIATKPIILIE